MRRHPEREAPESADALARQVEAGQVRAHYEQIPAMAIAPAAGMLFVAWVLWGAVRSRWLLLGIAAVVTLSLLRLALYRAYFDPRWSHVRAHRWGQLSAIVAAFSGCLWGSVAPLLYPPHLLSYDVFLLVLLALVPIVPVAALAVYMPAFYAYFVPCMVPLIVTLALQPSRAERLTAVLLAMMAVAMLTFARRYSRSLADAIALRLQLDEKARALEAAMRQKSHLIAAAGHDLRQPVHAMGLFLDALRRPAPGIETGGELIGHLDASLASLRGMLDNMLDLSRLDGAAVKPWPVPFALAPLLHQLAGEYRALADEKGIGLRCTIDPNAVLTDPMLIERILRNLLSNALKFTARGQIVLSCRARAGQVRLRVADSGVGIAAADLGVVFEEFRQLDRGSGESGQGLGLGLAIVRRLADLLGHRLRVRSRPGRGSVFSIELEAVQVQPDPAEPAAPQAFESFGPARVMVIDDDPAVADSTASLLQCWGLRVVACTDADAALRRLGEPGDPPALLIVDHRLAAGRSGFEAVQRIREQSGRPTPAIMISADSSPALVRSAFVAGHAILHKPVDPLRLRACVAEALASGDARG